MAKFTGLGEALITPFKSDDSIDFDALARLIEFQINGGVDYIVVLGTTAETPALSADERHAVRRFVVDRVAGRVPLVAGCGGNATAAVIHELTTDDLSGYDAILSVVPFYNKPSQRGITAHFSAIAEASPLPVILYNIPGRTGVNMEADTTVGLAHRYPGKIIAVKEASGNVIQVNRILAAKHDGFSVISGDDSLTFPLMSIGCDGVISVAANAMPASMKKLVSAAASGDYETARTLHRELTPIFRLLFAEGNPAGIKGLLAARGFCENRLRLPLVEVSDALFGQLRDWCPEMR